MTEKIQQKLIEEEMKESYVDYAMSVITTRALPNIRDGLKPVHRRILYTMYELGLLHNKPFKKSARIIGDCLGKYHPHGDIALYDALVRMTQDFSLRYPLIKGHGNFGSIDGDPAAALRYTEAKLSKISEELLTDIDKNTVQFTPNFDNTLKEPVILPAKLPNLLINGSSGIAVGMATNIPPHNISEIISAIKATIDNPDITLQELMSIIKGPDFPTGGIIYGIKGIKKAYESGKGKIILRAKTEIKDKKILIKEIPYQVNKTTLIENIASLVKNKTIQGISDIRDESDRSGLQIVLELKSNANPNVILNKLFKHTQLQITYGIIMLALVDNQPKILNLKSLITNFLSHRKDIIIKRTQFELKKAENRVHILEGLKTVIQNTDAIIKSIKSCSDTKEAEHLLISKFQLTGIQAKAILEMKLQKLTSLESKKLEEEYENLLEDIKKYKEILSKPTRILDIIKQELTELNKYSDERRTEIKPEETEIEKEDMIKEENVVITVTNSGYIKQTPLMLYKQQKRGGKGTIATKTKEQDIVENLFITSNLNYLLFFTNKGKVYWLKAYKLPEGTRYSTGKAIVNLLNLDEREKVTTILPIKQFTDSKFLTFATKKGIIKKTPLIEYSKPRKSGIKAITLKQDDEVIQVKLTSGNSNLILATKNGLAIKFSEKNLRPLSRATSGVLGIRLKKHDKVIGLEVGSENLSLLTVTENGYGKRTPISEYRLISRGGKGVMNLKITEKTGVVVSIKTVSDEDEIMLITNKGTAIRVLSSNIPKIGRITQGARIIKLNEQDKVAKVANITN